MTDTKLLPLPEIEALRRELDRLRGEHVRVRRDRNAAQARADRLAEVLREAFEWADMELEDTDALYPAWMDEAYAVLRQQGANHD